MCNSTTRPTDLSNIKVCKEVLEYLSWTKYRFSYIGETKKVKAVSWSLINKSFCYHFFVAMILQSRKEQVFFAGLFLCLVMKRNESKVALPLAFIILERKLFGSVREECIFYIPYQTSSSLIAFKPNRSLEYPLITYIYSFHLRLMGTFSYMSTYIFRSFTPYILLSFMIHQTAKLNWNTHPIIFRSTFLS